MAFKRKQYLLTAAGMAAILAAGCAKTEASVPAETEVTTAAEVTTEAVVETTPAATEVAAAATEVQGTELTMIGDDAVPMAQFYTPTASGSVKYENGKVILDASNTNQGYCMIKYTGSVPKIKVQITKGSTTYTYDLKARNAYEVFPFSEGSGSYSVKVFENVSGTSYSQAYSKDLSVSLANDFLPFLYPNQYVDFNAGSAVVQTANQVAAGAADQVAVVNNVYNYVVNNFTYDTAKASSVQSGYLPNVDQVLAAKRGICFDYAAVMTAMLRSQGIPTKLVVGYTGSLYHAWVNVYIENIGWVDSYIYFDGVNWKLMDPTFASSSGHSEEIKQYIGNGSNYQAKYAY